METRTCNSCGTNETSSFLCVECRTELRRSIHAHNAPLIEARTAAKDARQVAAARALRYAANSGA